MKSFLTTMCAVAVTCSAAQADVIHWTFPLDGLQEVPPVATPGWGEGQIWFDTTTLELSWNITYQDLIGTVTAAHFHGAADFGVNTGIQVNIPISASPLVGGPVSLTSAQADDLLAGLWYVNIHTNQHPGGEIRGQVVPEPAALALLGIGTGLLVLRRKPIAGR
ncbi:MAG: CHRD domain-containing protein [Phycisphaeraceae bacterium]|nr:CHRD domain-containing protein [Phycisphaeraceae bacterium]